MRKFVFLQALTLLTSTVDAARFQCEALSGAAAVLALSVAREIVHKDADPRATEKMLTFIREHYNVPEAETGDFSAEAFALMARSNETSSHLVTGYGVILVGARAVGDKELYAESMNKLDRVMSESCMP
jgi:hypothetical protein